MMHLRPDHAVRDLPTLHAFIRSHPLGIVTTSLPSEAFPTLQCSHIPWILDSDQTAETSPTGTDGTGQNNDKPFLGVLRGHMARANPQSKAIVEAVTHAETRPPHLLPEDILIVFTSPVNHYITPNFYVESKPATGKVAPTWNYAAVQVYGRATIYHDSKDDATGEFLHRQLSDLARLGEEDVMGYQRDSTSENGDRRGDGALPTPWKIADAPEEYIAALKKNIIGLQVEITRIEGRFKVSQEKGAKDRDGVVNGLEQMQTDRAKEMAAFVKKGRVVSPQ